MAAEFNSENFQTEVLEADNAVVVDFWAPWCGPCRQIGPVIDELATENSDVKIGKLNVDEAQDVAMKYGVSSIPAILFFKNGEVVDKILGGGHPKSKLQQLIDSHKS